MNEQCYQMRIFKIVKFKFSRSHRKIQKFVQTTFFFLENLRIISSRKTTISYTLISQSGNIATKYTTDLLIDIEESTEFLKK